MKDFLSLRASIWKYLEMCQYQFFWIIAQPFHLEIQVISYFLKHFIIISRFLLKGYQ